jgi:hypothetical protein
MTVLLAYVLMSALLPVSLDPQIDILAKNPSSLELSLTPGSEKVPGVITRFIFSSIEPSVDIVSLACDTAAGESTGEQNHAGPGTFVEIGKAMTLAGCRMYPVVIRNTVAGRGMEIRLKKAVLHLAYRGYDHVRLAPSQASVFKNLILNYEYDVHGKPQGLLIITPVSFYNAVLPLADWKEKKGWTTTVATLAQTGNTSASIKNYISNAYHNWNPAPEYVILIGDKDSLPAFAMPANPVNITDYLYGLIDGGDFLAEIMVGRLSVSNINELQTLVAKIVGYERTPYTTDTTWFRHALMVAANYPYDTMTTPIPTKRWVREKLLQQSISPVDTVYDPPVSSGQTAITDIVNQGVSVINYRGGIADPYGWDRPTFTNTDVVALANGWKLPVITSIVCNTCNFNYPACFAETWLRVGNPVTPKGAVGFFGATTPTTHSRWNNCLDYGMYWGLVEDSIYNFGPMTYRGKMEVYLNFPLEVSPDSGVEYYFNAYNLLGDPSLELWTAVPRLLNVSHASSVPVGTNTFSVLVQTGSAQPLKGALVSLYKRNDVKVVDFSDASGMAYFQISTATPDTLFVTVSKHDCAPYCGYALVNNSAVYVGYLSHTISDPGGNNNGEINPGETIQMAVTLKNYGTSTTATGVTAKLTDSDPLVVITDSVKSFGSISPGGTATGSPYVFSVSTGAKNGHIIKFNLSVTSGQGSWNSVNWVEVKAPQFQAQRCRIVDGGNGVLEPGETSDLSVWIVNSGQLAGGNVSGNLRSQNPGVSVNDSLGAFGTVPVGDSAENAGNRFTVHASPQLAPGHVIEMYVMLSGDQSFRDTVHFSTTIGVVTTSSPSGPDDYGYYAYDNTDAAYTEMPVYNWVEVDPALGGPGTILVLANDQTRTVALPFSFKYYGSNYSRVSICSNGFAALDSTWIADMYNWHILSSLGPPLLVAPFWDDLDPNATDSSGNVCYYNDAANHRFIIEWSRIQHLHNPTSPVPAELQTFEIVLYNPAYYPTQTGDGEIIFQYKKINNDDHWHNYATCGIENYGHTAGLEYTYANVYAAGAAALVNNRAIKFTTDQPDPYPGVEELKQGATESGKLVLQVFPNPTKGSVTIKFQMPDVIPPRGMADQMNAKFQMSIKIFDASGRQVRNFSGNPNCQLYNNLIIWYADDDLCRPVPSGIYFIELRFGENRIIGKIILTR